MFGFLQLFTGSHDRTIKIFDLDEMGYVETLFGHQADILALDRVPKPHTGSADSIDLQTVLRACVFVAATLATI